MLAFFPIPLDIPFWSLNVCVLFLLYLSWRIRVYRLLTFRENDKGFGNYVIFDIAQLRNTASTTVLKKYFSSYTDICTCMISWYNLVAERVSCLQKWSLRSGK